MIVYIDTLALLYRAYYAIPDLRAQDGTSTGALFGLTNTLFRIIAQMEPDHVVACFDRPEQTFRQESHESYKANREMPEEDMIAQIEAARGVLMSYGVHVVEKAGHEADDLLGTLALADARNGEDVVIVSCDGDLLQLTVHDGIRVYFLKKGMNDFVLYDEKEVEKKNGYPSKYIIDYKGLAGDASDNITGVPGIGDTFAKRLIAAFGGLDAIYKALDDGKLQEAGFTKRIETLLTDGKEHAFTSRDLATIHTDVPVRVPHNDVKPWKEMIVYADARETLERYSFESLFARLDAITGRSGDEKGADTAQPEDKMVKDAESPIAKEAAIMLWVLDASQTNAGSDDVRTHTRTEDYNDATKILLDNLRKAGRLSVWENIEKPLIPIIENMENTGICFDTAAAEKLSKTYRKNITSLTKKIHTLAGKEFNINSPKQLGEVLYTDLNLNPKRPSKTASGGRTTKESVLLEMTDDHSIIPLILEYRHYEKLRSTYTDALPDFVGEDGRIHTTFQQNGTTTGRLSSRDPNLQNIPVGGQDGAAIRNLFVAPDGWTMVSIDYSQIELRLAAILSQDKEMIQIFSEGGDIHTATAARIFSVPLDKVTSDQRSSAKAINFGILYGMGAQALRRSTGFSFADAGKFLGEYKKAFPGLFAYIDGVKRDAAESGSVTTVFGRVRPIDGITSSLSFVRAQAERMAVNSVVQGTAADIIKLAMISVDSLLKKKKKGSDVRMVLQIHDELLFEMRPEDVDDVVAIVTDAMESVYPPNRKPFPLVVNVRKGRAWGSLE